MDILSWGNISPIDGMEKFDSYDNTHEFSV